MKELKMYRLLCFFLLCFVTNVYAQTEVNENELLNTKQQSIVTIAAFTANGDVAKLEKALISGLDAGLTINEIKEVLVQLYAYAGFPRSLNALHTFMSVLKERKNKGIQDKNGKEPTPWPKGKPKLETGTENQTKLVGREIKGEVYEFAPAIDMFLKEHLFGDIFGRDNLDWKTRELATVAALASMGSVDNQLRGHFGVSLYNGLTAAQLHQLVSIIRKNVNSKRGKAAKKILQTVLAQKDNNTSTTNTKVNVVAVEPENLLFPKGEKITNNNFTGTAWLQMLLPGDSLNPTAVGNVTFEPGARAHWHYHPGGQILLATDGVGYYQEKGSPKKVLRKGDVVKCPPNVPHWHGASRDASFIQVAITDRANGPTVWLQRVTDEEYNAP